MKMKNKQVIDILNDLYEGHKDNFNDGYHEFLLSLLMTDILKQNVGKVALVTIIVEEEIQLGVVDTNVYGYTPTVVVFKKQINYEEAQKITHDLNFRIFNLNTEEAFKILLSSMYKKTEE